MTDSQLDRAIGIAFMIAATFMDDTYTKTAALIAGAIFYFIAGKR